MAKKSTHKTNAMRLLDTSGIPYSILTYDCDGVTFDGKLVAEQVGLPFASVFKTLVTVDDKGGFAVACIPVDCHLNLKALAQAASRKRLELLPLERLLAVTGYVRGGCSPVGMKKPLPTYIHSSVQELEQVAVSAGLRGMQLLLKPEDLLQACSGQVCELTQAE
ncbi:Cys-tRNA(Pro) deacylase [Oscillospiraceae bacterium MB08-C2-2]|nr:Cys-tRNA(Pro) deacylase [Oscillospiraceae bacterium MB08-C2-2]